MNPKGLLSYACSKHWTMQKVGAYSCYLHSSSSSPSSQNFQVLQEQTEQNCPLHYFCFHTSPLYDWMKSLIKIQHNYREVKCETVVERGFVKLGNRYQSRKLTPWKQAIAHSLRKLGLSNTEWPGLSNPGIRLGSLAQLVTDQTMVRLMALCCRKMEQGGTSALEGCNSPCCFSGVMEG